MMIVMLSLSLGPGEYLGVEMGDSGGGVGESRNSERSARVFFGYCGGGIIWAGRCCFCCGNVFVGIL